VGSPARYLTVGAVLGSVLLASACSSQAGLPTASKSTSLGPIHAAAAAPTAAAVVDSPWWQNNLISGFSQATVFLHASTGTGSRRLGTVVLPPGARVIRFEVWCQGRGSINVPKVFKIGPCSGPPGLWTISKFTEKKIVIDVQVAPTTTWALEGVGS
jgi:hypothetical protein